MPAATLVLSWSVKWEEANEVSEMSFSEWRAGTFLCSGLIPKPELEDGLKTIIGGFSRGFAEGWRAVFGGGGVLTQPHRMRTGTRQRALTDEDR